MLQFKKQSNWIQPNVEITSDSKPIMLNTFLESAKTVKEAEISSWDDIDRIDIRPDKGIAKIRSKNNVNHKKNIIYISVVWIFVERLETENYANGSDAQISLIVALTSRRQRSRQHRSCFGPS